MKMPNLPSMPNVMGLYTIGKTFLKAHRPELLLGASLAGTIGTGVLAAKGGYEARGIVEQHEAGRRIKGEEKLTSKEKIQLTWLCYLPAVGVGCSTLGATTALHIVHVNDKKMLAGMALAAIEEIKTEAKDYKAELEADKNSVFEANADKTGKVKHVAADGVIEDLYLVRDAYTGRDFWLNQERVKAAVNEVNRLMTASDRGNGSGCVDLNTFYMWAGVPELPRGEEYGWSGVNLTVEWEDTHREADGRPIREFTFQPTPQKGYDSGA